jgi:hypothetical protein
MNASCVFCSMQCTDGCCARCNQMNRGQKFARLLEYFERCSENIMYFDEIASAAQRIRQVSLFK